jgi:hypothetical protein
LKFTRGQLEKNQVKFRLYCRVGLYVRGHIPILVSLSLIKKGRGFWPG